MNKGIETGEFEINYLLIILCKARAQIVHFNLEAPNLTSQLLLVGLKLIASKSTPLSYHFVRSIASIPLTKQPKTRDDHDECRDR
jgi:hypothetical protein